MKKLTLPLFFILLIIGATTAKGQNTKSKSVSAIKAAEAPKAKTTSSSAVMIDPADSDAQQPVKNNTTKSTPVKTNKAQKLKKADIKSAKAQPISEPKKSKSSNPK